MDNLYGVEHYKLIYTSNERMQHHVGNVFWISLCADGNRIRAVNIEDDLRGFITSNVKVIDKFEDKFEIKTKNSTYLFRKTENI